MKVGVWCGGEDGGWVNYRVMRSKYVGQNMTSGHKRFYTSTPSSLSFEESFIIKFDI